jgi:hypothetical protein
MTETETGFWYQIYEKGSGKQAQENMIATINYKIELLDGTLCYTSDSLGSKTFKIGMGDVTGHGLESGVIMLMVQSITRTLLDSGEYNPVRFLTVLNSTLFKNIERINSDKNLTLSFIDYVDGKLRMLA